MIIFYRLVGKSNFCLFSIKGIGKVFFFIYFVTIINFLPSGHIPLIYHYDRRNIFDRATVRDVFSQRQKLGAPPTRQLRNSSERPGASPMNLFAHRIISCGSGFETQASRVPSRSSSANQNSIRAKIESES